MKHSLHVYDLIDEMKHVRKVMSKTLGLKHLVEGVADLSIMILYHVFINRHAMRRKFPSVSFCSVGITIEPTYRDYIFCLPLPHSLSGHAYYPSI